MQVFDFVHYELKLLARAGFTFSKSAPKEFLHAHAVCYTIKSPVSYPFVLAGEQYTFCTAAIKLRRHCLWKHNTEKDRKWKIEHSVD